MSLNQPSEGENEMAFNPNEAKNVARNENAKNQILKTQTEKQKIQELRIALQNTLDATLNRIAAKGYLGATECERYSGPFRKKKMGWPLPYFEGTSYGYGPIGFVGTDGVLYELGDEYLRMPAHPIKINKLSLSQLTSIIESLKRVA
jgi:hypothetical protein